MSMFIPFVTGEPAGGRMFQSVKEKLTQAAADRSVPIVAAEFSLGRFARRSTLLTAMLIVGSLPTTSGARQRASLRPPLPLQTMTYEEAEHAGTAGTGCTWRGGPGDTRRLAMADDRAAVKRANGVVALKPAADAKALFLTFDRWVGGTMHIVVRDTGKVVSSGDEFSETIAWLDLTEGGGTRSFPGRLNCGS
jgi:hypothetical protein